MTIADPFQTINADCTVPPGQSAPAQSSPPAQLSPPAQSSPPAPSDFKRPASGRLAQAVTPYSAEPTLGPRPTKTQSTHPQGNVHIGGRYDRVSELGRGGWGVVDRVVDRQLEREVAIKLIRVRKLRESKLS